MHICNQLIIHVLSLYVSTPVFMELIKCGCMYVVVYLMLYVSNELAMYVLNYVLVNLCVYRLIYVFMYLCIDVFIYVFVYLFIYLFMYLCKC